MIIDDEAPPVEETKNEIANVSMDKLAKVYRKMSARVQELTQAYENEVEQIKAQQEQVKNALKDMMLALGVSSVRTDQGTVVLSTKTRYTHKTGTRLKHSCLSMMQLTCWKSALRKATWQSF